MVSKKAIRYILGTLLVIIALNAFGGGYYGLSGAKDIPKEWLQGSPFHTYTIPSLFLFIVIGGGCLLAAITVFRLSRLARPLAIACGLMLLAWIGVQVAVIGYVSWMQPAIVISAIVILILAWLMPGKP